MKTTLGIAAGIAAIWLGNALGLWPVTIIVGGVWAAMSARAGRAVLLSLLTGALGWGLPLLWASLNGEVVQLATVVGGIMGLGGAGTGVVLALPLLIGGLLALAGAWITAAVRGVVRPSAAVTRSRAMQG